MVDTKAELTLNGDTTVRLDVLEGTLGQDVIDIRILGSKGVFTFDPDFTSTASYESKITFIDGDEGTLLHHDFPIDQLAADSNYLEVCYILLNGEKPTQEQYDEFKTTMTRYTIIHKQIAHLFHAFCHDSHSMVVMCGITGTLAAFYHDSLNVNNPRHREVAALRLLSKMPIMTAMCYKYSVGQPFVYPRNDLSYAGNFLNIMFSAPYEPYKVNPILERAINRILVLYTDHGQDASTSTMRTTDSSSANPFACIAASVASLQGPAHGGASEAALKMLEEIGSIRHTPEFVRRAKDKSDPFHLMGSDHRMYKNYGPRATVTRETCHEVLKELGTEDDLLEVAMGLENITLNDPYFIERKPYPNVDSYSGIILKAMGIPSSMFTIVFAMVRTVGRVARWSGMHSNGMKITHPRQLCTGYERRDFKSDIER